MQIPNNSLYTWMVINHSDGGVIKSITSFERRFIIFFARAGTYKVIVQLWNSQSHTLLLNATTTIIIAG